MHKIIAVSLLSILLLITACTALFKEKTVGEDFQFEDEKSIIVQPAEKTEINWQ